MILRQKDYGRNQKKRKEYIQSGFLSTEVDVSKAKHDACIGILEGVRCRIAWVGEAPSAHLFLIGVAYCKLFYYLKTSRSFPRFVKSL